MTTAALGPPQRSESWGCVCPLHSPPPRCCRDKQQSALGGEAGAIPLLIPGRLQCGAWRQGRHGDPQAAGVISLWVSAGGVATGGVCRVLAVWQTRFLKDSGVSGRGMTCTIHSSSNTQQWGFIRAVQEKPSEAWELALPIPCPAPARNLCLWGHLSASGTSSPPRSPLLAVWGSHASFVGPSGPLS